MVHGGMRRKAGEIGNLIWGGIFNILKRRLKILLLLSGGTALLLFPPEPWEGALGLGGWRNPGLSQTQGVNGLTD